MSKVSFRARQIDFNKPLPILTNGSDLLPEFNENALVNRGIPPIPSGMEKEEENEHHFVEVIRSLQLRATTDAKIPVPDIIDRSEDYRELYPDGFCMPKQLLHIRSLVLADDETTEYDMDTDDEEWLNKSQLDMTPLKFESMIDKLERGCGQKVMNLEEAKYLLKDDPSLVIAVYDYWLNKRVHYRQPLIYSVRHERGDGGNDTEPYIAFRRRFEKMQTRKNRKNDEQSYEKMLLLREQMENLGELLLRLVKRETVKENLIHCNQRCFETRYQLGDWDGTQLLEAEASARKSRSSDAAITLISHKESPRKHIFRKRKTSQKHSRTDVSESSLDSVATSNPFAFVRTQGCRYLKPREPLYRASPGLPAPHNRYSLTTVPSLPVPNPPSYTGYVRRRLGRGGRVIFDRLKPPSTLMDYFRNLDHSTDSPGSEDYHSPSQSKESALRQRLLPLIFSNHRRQPSFNWPVCTAFPTPHSFQPLSYNPLHRITQTYSDHDRCRPSASHSKWSNLSNSDNPTDGPPNLRSNGMRASVDLSISSKTDQTTIDRVDTRSVDADNTAGVMEIPPSTAKPSPKALHQPMLSPGEKHSRLQNSSQFWGKLIKRRKLIGASSFSDFGNAEVPLSTSSNIGSCFHSSSDDRPLLTDNSSLPPKVYCLPRDRLPRDHAQLATKNGITATQFYQLPT